MQIVFFVVVVVCLLVFLLKTQYRTVYDWFIHLVLKLLLNLYLKHAYSLNLDAVFLLATRGQKKCKRLNKHIETSHIQIHFQFFTFRI